MMVTRPHSAVFVHYPLVLHAYFLDPDRKARDPHNAKENEVVDIDKITQGGEDDTQGKDGRTSFLS
jgi:hypothetical protein